MDRAQYCLISRSLGIAAFHESHPRVPSTHPPFKVLLLDAWSDDTNFAMRVAWLDGYDDTKDKWEHADGTLRH